MPPLAEVDKRRIRAFQFQAAAIAPPGHPVVVEAVDVIAGCASARALSMLPSLSCGLSGEQAPCLRCCLRPCHAAVCEGHVRVGHGDGVVRKRSIRRGPGMPHGDVSPKRRRFCRPLTFQISMVGATVRSVWKEYRAWAGCHQLSVL